MLNPHIKPTLTLSQTKQKKPGSDDPIPMMEHHLLDIALFQACERSDWALGILHSTSLALRARGGGNSVPSPQCSAWRRLSPA